MRAKQFVGLVGLLAAGALLALWVYLAKPGPSGAAGNDVHKLRLAQEAASSIGDGTSSETASIPAKACDAAAPCGANSLANEMRDMRDARAFALAAWDHPERGGIFYAEYVTRNCKGLLRTLDVMSLAQPASEVSPEARTAAGQALAKAQRFCGQFTNGELEKLSLTSAEGQSDKSRDRFFALSEKLIRSRAAGDPAAQREAVLGVLRAGDPLLLDQVVMRLVATPQGLYFQGKFYRDASDREALLAAIRLVPCDIGLSCDGADMSLLAGCITQGLCYPSRMDQAREFYGNDARKLDQILAMKTAIAAALRSNDADAFVAKP